MTDGAKEKIAAVHSDSAVLPLSLMECAGWRPNRKRALEVLRPKRALPTTVLPVSPSALISPEQSVLVYVPKLLMLYVANVAYGRS